MDTSLSRTLTFSRNTTPAASLPLELQQEIFSHLDSASFYAARKVCRWWRLASFDTVTLARQLQRLPIKPTVNPRETEPAELQRLWNEAARTLLLGVRCEQREEDGQDELVPRSNKCLFARPKIAAVARGNKTVTINGSWVALFDTAQDPPKVLLQRRLDSAIDGARQIPWLQIAPAASHALALSSNGALLAVAQERTIQIYDLSAGPEGQTVIRTIASAAGNYIKSLDFEQNDRLLRVQLSSKGIVTYLGTPHVLSEEGGDQSQADIEHWKSKAGLRHTFLDSSLLQLSFAAAAGAEHFQPRLGGLQLLRPFGTNGFLFAAQKHGGNESSHYIYGHLRFSQPTDGLPIAVEPGSVTELARLESFLSAWDYQAQHTSSVRDGDDGGLGSWESMPSAHEHHPRFALSEDGAMLLLAEREKKRIRHVKWTQLFVYRVPGFAAVEAMVEEKEEREVVRWKRLERFLNERREDGALMEEGSKERPVVARMPLAVGSLEGEAMEVGFSKSEVEGKGFVRDVAIVTEEARRTWRLSEV